MRAPAFAPRTRWLVTAITLVAFTLVTGAQGGEEPPPVLTASGLLPPSQLKGAHHRVAESVKTDSYFHEFTVESEFGTFEAIGRTHLAVRIQEIEALAALGEVSKSEVFLTAAGQSLANIGKGAAAAVTDPVGTAKGIGGGVKRLGVNLGRRSQRAAEGAGDKGGTPEGEESGNAPGAGPATGLVAGSAAWRRWAQKVNVDPYTTNPVLQQALDAVAKVDVAGSIATKVVVPVPAAVGLTSSVGNLVWSKDPEELRKINEARLKEIGVTADVANALSRNARMTLTYQTRLIAALHAVRAAGGADYVRTAAEARSEREALFYVESAEMLQERHGREPISRLLTDSRALVATTEGGLAVVLLPMDWVRSTGASVAALRDIEARANRELGASRVEVILTGRASDRVTREFGRFTWTMAPAR